MGLRNIVINRRNVPVDANQSFDVRGISLIDIMRIMGDYGPQMSLAFGQLTAKRESGAPFDSATVRDRIKEMAQEFPDLLAAVVALAADEYDEEMVALVKKLPMLAQIEAVEAIFSLTFQSEGDVEKLITSLTKGMVTATGALNQVREISLDGIGGSVAN